MKHSHGKCLPAQAPGNSLRLPPDQVYDGKTVIAWSFLTVVQVQIRRCSVRIQVRSICRLKVSWKICHGGTQWLDDNRVVISSVFWGVWASSMRSTSQNPSARFSWSPLGRIFWHEKPSARQGNTFFGTLLTYILRSRSRFG